MNKGFSLIEMLLVILAFFVVLICLSRLSERSTRGEIMGELSPDAMIVSRLLDGEEVSYNDIFGLLHSGADRSMRLQAVAEELNLDYVDDILPVFSHNNLVIRYKLAEGKNSPDITGVDSDVSEE